MLVVVYKSYSTTTFVSRPIIIKRREQRPGSVCKSKTRTQRKAELSNDIHING